MKTLSGLKRKALSEFRSWFNVNSYSVSEHDIFEKLYETAQSHTPLWFDKHIYKIAQSQHDFSYYARLPS